MFGLEHAVLMEVNVDAAGLSILAIVVQLASVCLQSGSPHSHKRNFHNCSDLMKTQLWFICGKKKSD